MSLDGTAEVVAKVAGQPSGLGFLLDGRMLIVSMSDRRILRREFDSFLVEHADLSELASWHLNDMLVDHTGRAWIGKFGFDLMGGGKVTTTDLICVGTDGRTRVAAVGLGFPNGMAMTPDGGTLIVAETTMNRMSAFDLSQKSDTYNRPWCQRGHSAKDTPPTSVSNRCIPRSLNR